MDLNIVAFTVLAAQWFFLESDSAGYKYIDKPEIKLSSTHHRQSLALISLNVVSQGGSDICIQIYWGLMCDLQRNGVGGIFPRSGNKN